jgi:8-oxo-dGTP pyrophosphatase MutT (NUDIX family)
MRVVGCFLEHNNRFVLLRRHSHKPDGDSWGLPAGKVDLGESDEAALIRELYEETGYQADSSQLELLDEHQFHMPSGTVNDFVAYRIIIDTPHEVVLEDSSHSAYRWTTAKEAYQMDDLIFGLHEVFRRIGVV